MQGWRVGQAGTLGRIAGSHNTPFSSPPSCQIEEPYREQRGDVHDEDQRFESGHSERSRVHMTHRRQSKRRARDAKIELSLAVALSRATCQADTYLPLKSSSSGLFGSA